MDMQFPEEDYSAEIIAESRKCFCTPRVEVEQALKKWDEAGSAPPTAAAESEEVNNVIQQEEDFDTPLI